MVQHSAKDANERSSQVVLEGTLKIGNHNYSSNWVVADCRYDVLLGMPWHVAHKPIIDYENGIVKVNDQKLPSKNVKKTDNLESMEITNLSVKKFRRMLRKGDKYLQIYQVVQKNHTKSNGKNSKNSNAKLDMLLKKYETIFRDELPPGLPPKRSVDHEIKLKENEKPPHRPLFQLSPEELKACKEYVDMLIRKKKIRPSKSPYGAPLFFVKEKNNRLRGVVDYRALNRITKKNSTPLPRSDEMFDRLGEATVFSKMDLKTGFHQIRVKPEDIEKTAFNTKYGQFEYLVMPMG